MGILLTYMTLNSHFWLHLTRSTPINNTYSYNWDEWKQMFIYVNYLIITDKKINNMWTQYIFWHWKIGTWKTPCFWLFNTPNINLEAHHFFGYTFTLTWFFWVFKTELSNFIEQEVVLGFVFNYAYDFRVNMTTWSIDHWTQFYCFLQWSLSLSWILCRIWKY